MGRHHARKYGGGLGYGGYGRYGMRGGLGGLGALVPLLGLGVVAAILFSFFSKRRVGWGGLNTIGCSSCVL